MPLVCHLRLGLSLRQLPTRHNIRTRLLLPQVALRAIHDIAQKEGDHIREPQTPQASIANTSTPSTGHDHAERPNRNYDERKSPNTRLTHVNDFVPPTERRRDAFLGPQPDGLDETLGLPREDSQEVPKDQLSHGSFEKRLRHMKYDPQDLELQFIRAYDNLDSDSERRIRVLRGLQKDETAQRLRLANGQPTETDLSRYDEWKNAVKEYRPGSKSIRPMSIVEARQVHYLEQCTTIEEATSVFPRTPPTIKAMYREEMQKEYSRLLLMVAMRYVPDKLYLMFEAAHRSRATTPAWYVVEDVVELFARRLSAIRKEQARADAAHALADRVVRTLLTEEERDRRLSSLGSVESPRDRIQFTQFTIYSILAELPEAVVEPWYRQLCDRGCALHPYTEIKFAIRIAQSASTKGLSAHCLERLQSLGVLDINSPLAASVVTTLLSFSKKELLELDENSITPADLFRHLHGLGLIPNVITYTTIIRGLCLRGDLGTALDVFDVMHQHGVKPNEWTYSTLLHGCRLQSDWSAFTNIALRAAKDQVENRVVWNEVLFAIRTCVLRTQKDDAPHRNAIYALNQIYSRIFDAEPIRPFITARLADMGEHLGQEEWFPEPLLPLLSLPARQPPYLLQPGSDTIAIMLLGLVRALPLPYDLIVFYSQYRQMLKTGHPVARLMVEEQGSFVHNLVMRNLIKWPNTLRVAIDIMKDMTDDNKLERHTAPASSTEDNARASEESMTEAQFSATFATASAPMGAAQDMEGEQNAEEAGPRAEEHFPTDEQRAAKAQLAFLKNMQMPNFHAVGQRASEEQRAAEEQPEEPRVAEEQIATDGTPSAEGQSVAEEQISAAFATAYAPMAQQQATEEEQDAEADPWTEEQFPTEEQRPPEKQPEEPRVAEEQIATDGTPSAEGQSVADEPPQPEKQPQPKPERIRHPAPSVHTWSILIHGFMKAKQPKDAEYLIKLMHLHGVKPNLVTWNTLAAGYARMEMIPQAVKAMRSLEAAGHQADDWTMKAFQTIRNKAKAVQLMEATVEANKARILAAEQEELRVQEADLEKEEEATEQEAGGQAEIEQEGEDEGASETLAADKGDASTGTSLPFERLQAQWPHGIENDLYNSDAEAYLDSLIQRSPHAPDFSRNEILSGRGLGASGPNVVMSESKSAHIHKLVVKKLQASGTPVDEPRRPDLETWNHVRVYGLLEMPETAPRRAEGAEPFGGPVKFGPDTQKAEGPD